MMRSRFWALALVLVLAGATRAAGAQTVDVRAFAGLGSGVGVEGWLPGERVRIDGGAQAYFAEGFEFGGVGVAVPFTGTARRFFGGRAGYQIEYLGMDDAGWRGSRYAQVPDVGLVVHLESAGGSAFEAQGGFETVFRQTAAVCCDDAALQTTSPGLRLMVRGDLALSRAWALFAEAGLRTGDHVLELKMLPTLAAGVRVRL